MVWIELESRLTLLVCFFVFSQQGLTYPQKITEIGIGSAQKIVIIYTNPTTQTRYLRTCSGYLHYLNYPLYYGTYLSYSIASLQRSKAVSQILRSAGTKTKTPTPAKLSVGVMRIIS